MSRRRLWLSWSSGEFHTFAFAEPMFRQPLAVRAGEVVIRDGFVFADVLPEAAAAAAAAL
ncbi:MAG TPA: hypothetical protein VEH50_02705 [Methylomirabilota bacterium]|nr:hypothetical protein [Methylomirabilota bacterium]